MALISHCSLCEGPTPPPTEVGRRGKVRFDTDVYIVILTTAHDFYFSKCLSTHTLSIYTFRERERLPIKEAKEMDQQFI